MTATPTSFTFDIPAGEFLGFWTPDDPEWHAQRAGHRIGGSEIAAVLGLSAWESRFSLWHKKKGTVDLSEETEQMRWGRLLEDIICLRFAESHPELDCMVAGTWRSKERTWQVSNPDRLVCEPSTGRVSVVEAKNQRDSIGWGEPGTDEIPIYYRCQVQWQMDILGVDVAYLPVLFAGCEYAEYVVNYSPEDAAQLRAAGEEFLTSLRSNTPPDLDAHGQTYEVLRHLHPDIEDVDAEIPDDIATAYQQACEAAKSADETKQYAANRVLGAMGNARRATFAGQRIAIRVPGKGSNPPYLKQARS